MFTRLFGSTPVEIPSGYPTWDVQGFQERFELTAKQAERVRAAYLAILSSNERNDIAQIVIQFSGDMQRIVAALNRHADLHGLSASEVGRWLFGIERVRNDQLRLTKVVTQCTWLTLSCGRDANSPNPSHKERDGAVFDRMKGFPIDGGFELPGTAFRCNCRARPVLSWDD